MGARFTLESAFSMLELTSGLLDLFLVVAPQPLDVDQSAQRGLSVLARSVVEQLVDEALTSPSPMRQHVFKLDELVQVRSDLEVRPSRVLADLPPGEPVFVPLEQQPLALSRDHLVEQRQQPPGLGSEFVQRAPQHLVGQTVGDLDVRERHLDVLDFTPVATGRLDGALELKQQRDDVDQAQVLHVVPPGPGPVVEERQMTGIRIHHRQRPQQPLGVAVERQHVLPLASGQQPVQRPALPPHPVDGPGPLPVEARCNRPPSARCSGSAAPRPVRPPSSSARSSPAPPPGTRA
jgi:hypothetical protein